MRNTFDGLVGHGGSLASSTAFSLRARSHRFAACRGSSTAAWRPVAHTTTARPFVVRQSCAGFAQRWRASGEISYTLRVSATPETVSGLRDKYREIKRLREAEGRADNRTARAQMAALAQRFPGALRELDRLPLHVIDERLTLLERSLECDEPLPSWAPLQISYHGLMRAALRIKRMFAGHGGAANALSELASRYVPAADEPPLASLDGPALEAILAPTAGRLNPWAHSWVAAQHNVSIERVRDAFFWF
jgi:hypothetical protein